jgi:hypothetical protein
MANETIKIKVETDTSDSIKSLNNLETELNDLKEQIKDVEVGSKEFKKLSKQIINAEHEVKNLNKGFEGLDTEALTGEFGKMAGGITTAFTGIAVLGDDANESMEAMISTVGQGMAVAQGIKGATEAWTAAQRLLNFAMAANPIGLIVSAIGLLVVGIIALVSNGDKVVGILDGWGEKFKILQIPIAIVKAEIEALMLLWDKAKRFFLGDDAVDKAIKEKQEKLANDNDIKTNEMLLKRAKAEKKSAEEIYLIKKKLLEDKMKFMDKESDEYKLLSSELIGLEKEHTDKIKEEEDKKLKVYQDRLEKEVELKKSKLEDKLALDEEFDILDAERQEKANDAKLKAEQGFREAWSKEFPEDEEEDIEDDPEVQRAIQIADFIRETTLEGQLLTNEGLDELWKDGEISYKKYVKGKKKVAEIEQQTNNDNLDTLQYTLSTGAALFKKDSIERKAFSTANIIISTARAIMGFTEGYSTMPVVGQALAIAASIATGAMGAAQVAKVNSTSFRLGGVTVGPSHEQGGITTNVGELEGGEGIINKLSMTNPSLRNMASMANVAGGGKNFSTGDGSIKLDAESIAMIGSVINDKQVYVSENDITETQNRVSVIENESIL